MKALLFLKFLVFIFSILLLAGFTFIAYRIADTGLQSKIKTQSPVISLSETTQIPAIANENVKLSVLMPDEEVLTAFACGDNMCLITKNADKQSRVFVIYPQTGYLQTVIQLH